GRAAAIAVGEPAPPGSISHARSPADRKRGSVATPGLLPVPALGRAARPDAPRHLDTRIHTKAFTGTPASASAALMRRAISTAAGESPCTHRLRARTGTDARSGPSPGTTRASPRVAIASACATASSAGRTAPGTPRGARLPLPV